MIYDIRKVVSFTAVIAILLLSCSKPSGNIQNDGAEGQKELSTPEEAEKGSAVSNESLEDFYDLLQSIPEDLIGVPWQNSTNQYFTHILKILRLNYDGIESFQKTDNFFSFGGEVYNENEELEEGFYAVNKLRLWVSESTVVIGWTKSKEHLSLQRSETINTPIFFVRKDGIWRNYPIENIFPVAFASDCFFSPYDDRIWVTTEDEVGDKAEYVLEWQDGRFAVDKSGSPFIGYDFQRESKLEFLNSSVLSEQQILNLDEHFSEGTLLNASIDLLFPKDFSRFLNTKIQNDEPWEEIEVAPLKKQSYPAEVDLYVFSMDYGQETASGKIVFFRTMKNGKWVSEVTQFDGGYTGAVPERIELDYSFSHSGFTMNVKDDIYFMAFPDLWVSRLGIPWEVAAANNVATTFVVINENGKLDLLSAEKALVPELIPTLEMEKSLIATKKEALSTYRAQLYQKEPDANIYILSQDQQLEGEKRLRQMYLKSIGNLPSKPARFNLAYQSIVDGLSNVITNDKKPEVKSLGRGVSYYEGRLEYDDTPYTIVFNNISIPENNLSGKFEDLYVALLNQFKLNFQLFQGEFKKIPDITNSGSDNYILTFQGGYHTTIERSFELFRFDSLGVFVPTNAAFSTVFEGGICDTPIGNDLSVDVSGNKLILTIEMGKDDRQPGAIDYNCTSKRYQETYIWDTHKQLFLRTSFNEIIEPNNT